MTLAALAAVIVGLVLFFTSKKQREDNGEWSGGLQWGYLLMMVGAFGLLAMFMSFTAVLLIFVLFTGAVWLWHKQALKRSARDDNHFSDYMSGFFPIITIVFVLRTFVAEPFVIPSSSMRPGLVPGDFVLVSKFSYGIRVPVLNNVLVPTGEVGRGDVAVFNYPPQPSVNYIKRIVGLPGDVVEYRNKELTVNGVREELGSDGDYAYRDDNDGMPRAAAQFQAALDGRSYEVLQDADKTAVDAAAWMFLQQQMQRDGFDSGLAEHCEFAEDGSGFRCTVPEGRYFAMGDNRDNSADSRYWGFVDDKLMVGKAFIVWMNVGEMSRIGTRIQ